MQTNSNKDSCYLLKTEWKRCAERINQPSSEGFGTTYNKYKFVIVPMTNCLNQGWQMK